MHFARLTTYFGLISSLFCSGLALWGTQKCAVYDFCVLSCRPERRCARSEPHGRPISCRLSPSAALLCQKNAFR